MKHSILAELEEKLSEYTEMCTPLEGLQLKQAALILLLEKEKEHTEYLRNKIRYLEMKETHKCR